MDSAPVECIPAGSLVTVLKTKVTPKYGLKSRRVLVQYFSPNDGSISEGWASVQSSQGYTILSPLIDVCYTNSRWGCTRPIIRQCGHAAHLTCVHAHVASIHQKAEQDTPFDGRFAAEIGDGEFLCPLCKQLSNIVVPVEENDKDKQRGKLSQPSIGDKIVNRFDVLKNILGGTPRETRIDENKKIAVKQFGTYLYQAMEVTSWDRSKSSGQEWHRALTSWDYKEDQSDFDTENIAVGDILPLMRQQLIAWASAGHGAAAAEASTRGVMKSGFEPPTSDPWVDFNQDSRDTHPMLLELRRNLVAAASLYEVVGSEIIEKLSDKLEFPNSFIPIVGLLLSHIISGTFWTSTVDGHDNPWSTISALLASTPCHVSRDETLSSRHEARAISAQIWAVKGGSYMEKQESSSDITVKTGETKLPTPPVPMCISNIPGHQEKLNKPWGCMDQTKEAMNEMPLFSPALASGYLYMPLLSWDLNTFAGAVFSTLLSSKNLEPQAFCDTACILLVARLIQVLITSRNFKMDDENVSFECEMNIENEKTGLVSLLRHCNVLINPADEFTNNVIDDGNDLLSSVSNAILPYARMLILLLRAAFSVARQKGYEVDTNIEVFIEDEDTMYIEDGLYLMQKLGCPLPSEINESICNKDGMNSEIMFWGNLINKWIHAVVSFDSYHGSEGSHLEFRTDQKKWIPVTPSINTNKKLKSENQSVDEISSFEQLQESDIQVDTVSHVENNDDETMDGFTLVENQDDFEQVDSPLDMGADFEDDPADDDNPADLNVFGIPSFSSQASHDNSGINHYFEESVCSSSEVDDDVSSNDDMYANIASATIIPYQASLLGNKKPGPGPRGSQFDYNVATPIMSDLSHLGITHNTGKHYLHFT